MKNMTMDKSTIGGLAVIGVIATVAIAFFLSSLGDEDNISNVAILPEADGSQPITREQAVELADDSDRVADIETSEVVPAEPQPATQEDVADLVRELETKIAEAPGDFETLVELGALYYQLQVYPRAADMFSAALDVNPDDAGVRSDLASSFLYQGMIRLARNEYRRAIETDPELADAHFNLGISYSHSSPQDIEAALSEWERVIELEPDSELAVAAQGFIDQYQYAEPTEQPAEVATAP